MLGLYLSEIFIRNLLFSCLLLNYLYSIRNNFTSAQRCQSPSMLLSYVTIRHDTIRQIQCAKNL